jgi:hypothetical protein
MTESATSLSELAVRPSHEEIIGSIKHSKVKELLHDAKLTERRLKRELEALDENEELTEEAKAHRADELIGRFSPQIADNHDQARKLLWDSIESSYRFSLPFPEGKTYAQARAKDTSELLAVQAETEALFRKLLSGKSLQEVTKARSKNPKDKGIQQREDPTLKALQAEFDQAMGRGGIEGRVKAMAIERYCELAGYDLETVVDHHRTPRQRQTLQDARDIERQWRAVQSGKSKMPNTNPFTARQQRARRVGTYQSANKAMVAGSDLATVFAKNSRKRPWK